MKDHDHISPGDTVIITRTGRTATVRARYGGPITTYIVRCADGHQQVCTAAGLTRIDDPERRPA